MSPYNFSESFEYEKGVPFLDGWRNISNSCKGDSDDFAWTRLVIVEGGGFRALWSLLTFKAVIWHVRSGANAQSGGLKALLGSHSTLWHRDHGWSDSTFTDWGTFPNDYNKRWPQVFPWVLFRVLWGATIGRFFG